jgi:hypothetical protein
MRHEANHSQLRGLKSWNYNSIVPCAFMVPTVAFRAVLQIRIEHFDCMLLEAETAVGVFHDLYSHLTDINCVALLPAPLKDSDLWIL